MLLSLPCERELTFLVSLVLFCSYPFQYLMTIVAAVDLWGWF